MYWKTGAEMKLKNLNSADLLATQLGDWFSIQDSPIWMDSSTSKQCGILESLVGGPEVS